MTDLQDAGEPRICVSNVYYFANTGDAALLLALIAELRRVFGRPSLVALTMEDVDPGQTLAGVRLEPSLMSLAYHTFAKRFAKGLYTIWVIGLTVCAVPIWRLTGVLLLPRQLRRATLSLINADLVVTVGGGYLRGKKDLATHLGLILMLHPIWLAALAGVPVMCHSQSIGPFGNRFQRWVTAKTLSRVELLAAREDISVDTLKGMGLGSPKIIRSADAGFLFETSEDVDVRTVAGLPADAHVVGVTVRQWLHGEAQERYEAAVATACDHMIRSADAYVVFIPQVTVEELGDDDRIVGHRVADQIVRRDRVRVMDESYSPFVVKALYESLDLLVGTRFHSVIFALTACVPAIAIEYEHKTGGIMAELGLGEWVCDINTVTGGELIERFEALLLFADDYRALLHSKLDWYKAKAQCAAEEMHERFSGAHMLSGG
jgi:colanic acid/amylovoran biosynthesis protein